ncbi:MAG: preprotein translocase subunit SecE [Magnetococcales bacterium]|nr:preprotein translocase subunit SecE [Magnetococcales bacterium]
MERVAQLKKYLLDVRAEAKKVVWPTREETRTTTLVVFVMVILVSLFLWLVDAILGVAVRFVVG